MKIKLSDVLQLIDELIKDNRTGEDEYRGLQIIKRELIKKYEKQK